MHNYVHMYPRTYICGSVSTTHLCTRGMAYTTYVKLCTYVYVRMYPQLILQSDVVHMYMYICMAYILGHTCTYTCIYIHVHVCRCSIGSDWCTYVRTYIHVHKYWY